MLDYPKYLVNSRIWASILMLLFVTSTTLAQEIKVFDFMPIGSQLELDGENVRDAQTFKSRSTGSILILSPGLPAPLLIKLREDRVETLNLVKFARGSNGAVKLTGATLPVQAPLKMTDDRTGLAFDIEGTHCLLRDRPPLLGHHDIADLEKHSPEYRRTADAYRPSDFIIARLQNKRDEVIVRVYFASWCGYCRHIVPRIMNVAEQLEGSSIKFDFYGVPRNMSTDPTAEKAGIKKLPTGVLFLNGKEVGRIPGMDWKKPEQAIDNLLTGSPKSPTEIRDIASPARLALPEANK